MMCDTRNTMQKLLKNDFVPERVMSDRYTGYVGDDFIIKSEHLRIFEFEVKSTKIEYVHPTVFTNLIKQHHKIYHRIVIPEDTLYRWRVWCNVYRNSVKSGRYLEYYLFILAKTIVNFIES